MNQDVDEDPQGSPEAGSIFLFFPQWPTSIPRTEATNMGAAGAGVHSKRELLLLARFLPQGLGELAPEDASITTRLDSCKTAWSLTTASDGD